MKIIYFYQYFGTPKGGWSTRVYELTRRWVKAGHDVTVVTSPYDKSDIKPNGFISRQEIEGVKLIVINAGDSNRFSILKRVVRAVTFAVMSIYYAIFQKYDIAIASSGPITIGLPLIFSKLIRNRKTIFEVRDLWPAGGIEMGLIKKKWQQNLALWFEKQCYKNADVIVTSSIGQQKHIANRFPHKPVEVIPNASDIELFESISNEQLPEWTTGKKILTHIGSLGLIHNMQYWIQIANEVAKIDDKNEFLFVFIGDGAERADLESQVQTLGLSNVKFLGLKPKDALPIWVQNSVATLFATLDNPVQNTCSPNKIFDSFAAGVPIIQTSTGWIYELVKRSNCGINISLNNPQAGAQAIVDLANTSELRDEMAKNAKTLAETDFNRGLLADKYLTFMQGD